MQTPSRAPRWTLRLFPPPFPHYLSPFNHSDLVLALSFPLLAIHAFFHSHLIPSSGSLSTFFLTFFILPFSPSLPPFLYTQRVVTLGLDRTDLLFTCARNNYIQPRFFCHEPRSYELARGGNELSYCKIVPGCNCKRVLRPATRGRLFKRSVLRSALNRRISLYYRQRYERISFGKVLWRMENFHGNNEPIENNSLILGWKTFRVSATRVCYCIVFIFE